MASNSAPIQSADSNRLDEQRDQLLARLIYHASSLANASIDNGLGLMHCRECHAEWLISEAERHVEGCRVGNVRATLQALTRAYPRLTSAEERRSAEPADCAAGTAGERPCAGADYDEPWRYGRHATVVTDLPGLIGQSGSFVPASSDRIYERIVACVNYCAGISNEMLASLIPLRELGIGTRRRGVDALLGEKGGSH